jgi:TetR/AcrR family transcriptional regulator
MRQIAESSRTKPRTEPQPVASATRSTILAAATPLFASSGIQGTTIRQIAVAADVNSQLIYYYFGNKVGLFRAVLESAASRVAALLAHAEGSDGPPRKRLACFVSEWVKVALEQAPALRMLHRAMLEGDKTLAAEIQRYSADHASQIGSLIDEGKATGAFRASVDTRRAVASLVGMVQYLALAEAILFTSTNLKQNRNERDAMAQHTAELFLRGLDTER